MLAEPSVIVGTCKTVRELRRQLEALPQEAALSFDGTEAYVSVSWDLKRGNKDVVNITNSPWCRVGAPFK